MRDVEPSTAAALRSYVWRNERRARLAMRPKEGPQNPDSCAGGPVGAFIRKSKLAEVIRAF